MILQFLPLFALATASIASPLTCRAIDIKPYIKPKSTDSRSPCPMLNTLANHGYLPHDGHNITAEEIGSAILSSTNWSADFGLGPATTALKNLNQTTLSLSDLDSPAGGEHPASLTRADSPSDSNNIDVSRVHALLLADNEKYLTIESVARSRNRVEEESADIVTGDDIAVGRAEAALMMLLMRDTSSYSSSLPLRAPKDRTRVWLLEEKFPVDQGWRPAKELLELDAVGPVSEAIAEAQDALKGEVFGRVE
ncbi:Cloroperoxidase [Poronia punctata]|nr:Cloroperoxidase [Poronia punctata]